MIGATRSHIDLAHEADFIIGRARVRPALCRVVCGAAAIPLQPRIMQVLVTLAQADGAVVSRDELIACCWGAWPSAKMR